MNLKRFSLIILGVAVLLLGAVMGLPLLAQGSNQDASGIIGGADAPTKQFLMHRLLRSVNGCRIFLSIAMLLSGLFCLLFSKTVRKHCTIKTTAISLGLSGVGAAGLACLLIWFSIAAFGSVSAYPIRYPASILLGMLSLVAFMILIAVFVCQ